MMKQFLLPIIAAIIFFSNSNAQEPADPFNWKAPIVLSSSDIFLLWSEGPNQNSMKSFQKMYKYNIDSASAPPDNRLIEHVKDSSDVNLSGNKKMDVASGNLNGDEIDEVIAIWERSDHMIELLIPHFDTTDMAWSTSTNKTIAGPVIAGNSEQGRIFVRTGDFDGDKMDEFIVAFLDDDYRIHLEVYDTEGTLVPELKASLTDEVLSANPSGQVRFSISTGDFDMNGDDEIVLAGFDNGLFIKVYDVAGSIIIPKGREIIIRKPVFTIYDIELTVTTLHHFSLNKDIIAAALTYMHNEESFNIDDTHMQLVEVSADLESLMQDSTKRYSDSKINSNIKTVLLASGDLNNDDKSELVFAIGNAFDVYTPDDELNLVKQLSGGIPGVGEEGAELEYSYEYLAVADVDQNLGDEIVAVRNIFSTPSSEDENDQYFEIAILGTPDDTLKSLDQVARIQDEEAPYTWPNRNYALALGNFDASKVTIHKPVYNRISQVTQPIVILNAPPVHFDVFDSLIYDINNCYEGEPCDFIASYVKSSSESNEVSTTVQAAWDATFGAEIKFSVSATAAPGGIGGGVSVPFESHILGTYGENLESTSSQIETISIKVEVNANEDDQIFATLTDYDVWEYPYTTGENEKQAGSIWTLVPVSVEGRWFPSKSVSGTTHRSNHEVGNILSYYEYGDLNDHPDIVQNVVTTGDSPTSFTLNASTPYTWSLYGDKINLESTDMTIEHGVDLRLQYGFFVFESTSNNAYVYTHKTAVEESLQLKVDLGNIDRSYGPTEYRVTPYAYWSKQGALVVDYSVEPEVDNQGGKTWWQEMYGDYPDPTLILPWRLDPEKGFGINEEAKRQQTKDIVFDPAYPRFGDTVLITATIRNFSLKETPGPVKVEFFIGDPDNGGTLLSDIEGNTEFETKEFIPARGLKTVELFWILPDNLAEFQRIYVVIDPDDSLEEIHEDNNTGWTVIGNPASLSSSSSPEIQASQAEVLHQNYPNPFSDASSISYSLSKGETIKLSIYNISGKLLKTYNEGFREAGSHTLEIDGNLFESGIYYYTIQGSFGKESRKMVIMH